MRPFCSLARTLIDLGGWLDETHRVPGAPLSLPTPSGPDGMRADE